MGALPGAKDHFAHLTIKDERLSVFMDFKMFLEKQGLKKRLSV